MVAVGNVQDKELVHTENDYFRTTARYALYLSYTTTYRDTDYLSSPMFVNSVRQQCSQHSYPAA